METGPSGGLMPGQPFALQVVHPGSPTLRVRYRHGILVDPYGYPDWLLYARALVSLPPPRAGRAAQRPLDVLAANEAMARSGDPLWTAGTYVAGTPHGWVWAHLPASAPPRQVALVPADLHGSYRHGGGLRALPDGPGAAVTDAESHPVRWRGSQFVPANVLADLEAALGQGLPPAYRQFLARTNGGAPDQAAVLPAGGFVVDQPWLGVAMADRQQDLLQANAWFRDRFSRRYLAIGYVQGGLLVVDAADDSVWFWDDDDPRARHDDTPAEIERRLVRCADTVDGLLAALATPAGSLLKTIDAMVDGGEVVPRHDELAGSCLPPRARPAWQAGRDKAASTDPVARLLDAVPAAPGPAAPGALPAARPAAPEPDDQWRPANEAEAAMAEALRAGDQRRYADVLAGATLYLPGFASDPPADQTLVTWTIAQCPHLLVFTSLPAMAATLASWDDAAGPRPDSFRTTGLAELTSRWPDPSWRLAIDPHLPIGAALEPGAVALMRSGQMRLAALDTLIAETARSDVAAVDPIEAELDRALDGGAAEAFLATLRGARAYLPLDDTGEWVAVPVEDGSVHVVAFTSAERCAQWLPEEFGDVEMYDIAMTDLARDWPGPRFRLSLNPSTPVAVILDAAEVSRIRDG